jgi:hypothetical protein
VEQELQHLGDHVGVSLKKTTSGANIMVVSQSVGFMVDMLVCQ